MPACPSASRAAAAVGVRHSRPGWFNANTATPCHRWKRPTERSWTTPRQLPAARPDQIAWQYRLESFEAVGYTDDLVPSKSSTSAAAIRCRPGPRHGWADLSQAAAGPARSVGLTGAAQPCYSSSMKGPRTTPRAGANNSDEYDRMKRPGCSQPGPRLQARRFSPQFHHPSHDHGCHQKVSRQVAQSAGPDD
jgi:hypothetical protein